MELFRLIDDEAYVISDFRIYSEEVMEVVTKTAEEEYERSFKTMCLLQRLQPPRRD